jgi:hypothetical protein
LTIHLTSQEKKALGFIAVMVVLGLLMLAIKRFENQGPVTGHNVAPVISPSLNKTGE